MLLFAFVAAACAHSNSSQGPLLGSAVIGVNGGVLAIDTGTQTGLRLVVPPGALLESTEIRVRDATPVFSGPGVPVIAAPPNVPFVLEPTNLELRERATLRLPYRITGVYRTAPGNVRARETRNGIDIDHAPDFVSVEDGYAEVQIRYLSKFQVVQGEPAQNIASYWQADDTSVELEGGITFSVESVVANLPFAAVPTRRWRIRSPSAFPVAAEDLLYFANDLLLGRESVDHAWREAWSEEYPVWQQGGAGASIGSVTMPMQVYALPAGLPIGGQITVFGMWTWSAPRRVADRLLYDIAELRVTMAWNRLDIGVGQREYRFWFAPGIGLVGFAEDGLQHARLTLP